MNDNTTNTQAPAPPPKRKITLPKLSFAGAMAGGKKLPPLRAPKKKFPYRTLKEMLWAWRWGMARLGVAIVVLVLVAGRSRPAFEQLVEQQYSGEAVSKARVLLRSAQLAAGDELWNFATHDETVQYLMSGSNLKAIIAKSRFEVEAVEITDVSLDENGIIDKFDCVIDNDYRRYRVVIDVKEDRSVPELLEELPKPDKK